MAVNPLSLLTDSELATMTDRAYREAARCYQEARANGSVKLSKMLNASASDATMYWIALTDEQNRREQAAS